MTRLKVRMGWILIICIGFYFQSCKEKEINEKNKMEEKADTIADHLRDVNEGVDNGLDEIKDGSIVDSLKDFPDGN